MWCECEKARLKQNYFSGKNQTPKSVYNTCDSKTAGLRPIDRKPQANKTRRALYTVALRAVSLSPSCLPTDRRLSRPTVASPDRPSPSPDVTMESGDAGGALLHCAPLFVRKKMLASIPPLFFNKKSRSDDVIVYNKKMFTCECCVWSFYLSVRTFCLCA